MANRNVRTPRKTRLWVTSRAVVTLVAVGQAGQAQFDLSAGFITKTGRELTKGDTLAHSWIKGHWSLNIVGTPTVRSMCCLAISFEPRLIDAIDFPNIAAHDGDLQLHDARVLQEGVAAGDVMLPPQLAAVDIESSGQRSVPAGGNAYSLFLNSQITNIGGGQVSFLGSVTTLWLI